MNKKRLLALSLAALLLLSGCAGAKKPQSTAPVEDPAPLEEVPDIFPNEFYFASGVGAWGTVMNVYADGSFDGDFHDSDMGIMGEGYPGGTVYYCHFSGRFGALEKVSDYIWRTTVDAIEVEEGEDYIEDEILWSFSTPYGMEHPGEILLYLPGIHKSQVPEEFVNWSLWYWNDDDTLNAYGLYNVSDEAGFVAPLDD